LTHLKSNFFQEGTEGSLRGYHSPIFLCEEERI